MKGLLQKDFRLLRAQRNYFLMIGVIALNMAFLYDDVAFMQGFLFFMLSQFAVSTISYDEFDNGYAFLFTLPVSRRTYALEKYLFGWALAGGAWIFSMVLALAVTASQGGSLLETLLGSAAMLPIVLLIQSVMIPFQLKFGGEKGRLVMMIAMGAVVMLFIAATEFVNLESLGMQLGSLLQGCSDIWLILGLVVLMAIVLAASMRISVGIMEHKEF